MKKTKCKLIFILSCLICFIFCSETVLAAISPEDLSAAAPAARYTAVGGDAIAEANAMPIQTNEISGWPQGPVVPVYSAILMDIDTGAVLYGKNIYDQHYPASITKVMTSLTAIRNGQPEDPVVISHDAVYNIEAGSASCGMYEGEEISLDTALRCMMSQSANDVAYAIAENVGGNFDTFIQMMNNQAEGLGCVNSHFANPHGLFDPDHYVCAYDMALIASAAYKSPWFRDFCHLETYNRPITAQNPDNGWVIYNRHQMFHPESTYYDARVTGGKTGFTDEARTTLVTFAEINGMRLVSVVLRGEGAVVYDATSALLNYCSENFERLMIRDIVDRNIIEKIPEKASVTVPSGKKASDLQMELEPGKWNQGHLACQFEQQDLGAADITFTYSYLQSLRSEEKSEIVVEKGQLDSESNKFFYVIAIIFGVAAILFMIAAICLHSIKKKRKKISGKNKKGK